MNDYGVLETVSCKLCGNPTTYIKVALCCRCWTVSSHVRENLDIVKKIIKEIEEGN